MTAASPGIIATTLLNAYYDSHERYIYALARQMQREYELIHSRGLTLQLDCPDLAMERTRYFQHDSLERFQEIVAMHIEAINLAVINIPAGAYTPARVLGQLRWTARARRAAGGHSTTALQGQGRRPVH